jgi:hypothetical protein
MLHPKNNPAVAPIATEKINIETYNYKTLAINVVTMCLLLPRSVAGIKKNQNDMITMTLKSYRQIGD